MVQKLKAKLSDFVFYIDKKYRIPPTFQYQLTLYLLYCMLYDNITRFYQLLLNYMPAVHAFVRGNGFLFNIFPLGFMVLFIVFVAMPGKDQHNFFYLNTRSNKTISNKPLMLLTVSNRNLLSFYSLQLYTKKIVDRMKY